MVCSLDQEPLEIVPGPDTPSQSLNSQSSKSWPSQAAIPTVGTSPTSPPRAVVVLACALVAFSLLNIILLSFLSDPPLAKTIQRAGRLLFTCLLAYFLWRGARWARWISLVIAALAVVTSFIGFAALPESVSTFFRVWMLVMGVFYLMVALLLLIPSNLTRYYTSPR
jgi:peptidoglycan/LPS O-acetylase OafA/YrhL